MAALSSKEENGFTIMALSCLLRETLESFYQGWPKKRLVPGGGIEPPRAEARRILSPLRLPVPPSRLGHLLKTSTEEKTSLIDSQSLCNRGLSALRPPAARALRQELYKLMTIF